MAVERLPLPCPPLPTHHTTPHDTTPYPTELPVVDSTQMLSNFHAFTSSLPFDLRGETIGQQNSIRNSHNKFARPEPFVAGKKETAGDDDDVFHFVAYVPGPAGAAKAYELDGLQTGPIALGRAAGAASGSAAGAEAAEAEAGPWFIPAKSAIMKRIAAASEGNIKFNLMAVVKSRLAIAAAAGDATAVAEEEAKRARYKKENAFRTHNWIPLLVKAMEAMARGGTLAAARARAEEEVKELVKKAREERAAQEKKAEEEAIKASLAEAGAS